MTTTFQASPKLLFTSESVTEGHPDKVCDQISDAVLDLCLSRTTLARVACEASIKSDEQVDWVAVYGEVTPLPPREEVIALVRQVLTRIGYTDRAFGTSGDSVDVHVLLSGQSGDIALGVNRSLEAKEGSLQDDLDTGAGDQGMMFGFACDETPELMPMTIALAHRLTRRLSAVRKQHLVDWLRPDGKSQVTVEYNYGEAARVDTVVISTQHAPDIEQADLQAAVRALVVEPVLDEMARVVDRPLRDADTRYLINPTGRFVIGGPFGDSGLTGRKIVVDTYGGMARHGGGAFSGKDPTKVDRSAAYAARWVAKNVVAAGLARRCEVQLAYAIGVARPVSVAVETFGTERISTAMIQRAIEQTFDLRPAAIIQTLGLRRPIFSQTAADGHFGRTDVELPWEQADRVEALRDAAGAPASPAATAEALATR
ncbi:MAG: methionine adenosyltransferase [Chloroflexi bacterium]|nr:methionine adenosyltransferase [Chloroflexota bacterium]